MTASKERTVTHEVVERKVGDLFVDPNVQRSLKKHRVNTLAADFNPDALGVLTTSWRSARRIHVVDGQHRYRVCELVKYEGVLLTHEYHGLALAEEAALFRMLNTAEKPNRVDAFIVRRVEGDPATLAIEGYLKELGWSVSSNGGEGRLTAVASLERVYAMSSFAAQAALAVLTHAFGHRPTAVQGSLLEGLGRMLARCGTDVDLDDLAKRMASIPGGPDGLVGNARGQLLTRTGNLSTQVARVIVDLYNQRRRTTALPPWS